jgi:hypothetical protein
MTLKLHFVRETVLARLYRNAAGAEQWVPRSVCDKTTKWPGKNPGELAVHEVTIADWWLGKNPWPSQPAQQKELI